jgi:putative chitinase
MTLDQLKEIMPHCPGDWAHALLIEMPKSDVNTTIREAAFIGQFAVETNEFRSVEENLRYSVSAMMRVWPKRFPTIESAVPYEQSPEALANFVYANRMGNGHPESGDGWMYRGRGPQLTGRDNYRAAGLALNLPLEAEPERVCRPEVGSAVAGWFWYSKGCNELADKRDYEGVTRKINGGLTGYGQRIAYRDKAMSILKVVNDWS